MRRHDTRATVDTLLRTSFRRIDTDNDGKVNAMDLQRGLQRAGVPLTTDETTVLLSEMDRDHTGQISYNDFYRSHEEFIQSVFNQFDVEKQGYLDDHVLQCAFEKLGIAVTLAEARKMISELEPKDPNRLTFTDFHDLYLLLRTKMVSSPSFDTLLWNPDIRKLSKQWWVASIEVGEGGLRMPIPASKDKRKVDASIRFVGGALSGVIEALMLTPLDVTKTRLQLDKSARYTGMIDCAKKMYRSEGPLALYKGFTPWTAHVVMKNGSRFYFNAIYRRMLADENGQVKGSMEFLAGAMAGATEAMLIVTPFEVQYSTP